MPASADYISDTLGSAGPTDFALLEIDGGNVSLANASNAGFITGNVGLNGGNLSDSGVPITGNQSTAQLRRAFRARRVW